MNISNAWSSDNSSSCSELNNSTDNSYNYLEKLKPYDFESKIGGDDTTDGQWFNHWSIGNSKGTKKKLRLVSIWEM